MCDEATDRYGWQLPLHGDGDHLRPCERARDLLATERGLRPLRGGLRPLRVDGRPTRTDASQGRRSANAASTIRTGSTIRTSTSTSTSATSASLRPGGSTSSAEQISRIVGRPMDRTRPLWEVYVIEGLESGRWALLTKYHHATIDGASGVMMLMLIHDLTPDAPPLEESPPWHGEPVPGDLELLRLALGNLARNPAKAVRAQLRHRSRPGRVRRHHERQHRGPPGGHGRQDDRDAVSPGNDGPSASRCRARRHRRLRGTSRSPRTAASPCARPPCRTSSA